MSSATQSLYGQDNWKNVEKFRKNHEEPSQNSTAWFSNKTWEALGTIAKTVADVAIAIAQVNSKPQQVGLVNISNTTNVAPPRKTKRQEKDDDNRTIAACGGLLGALAIGLGNMLYGRIKKINREIAKVEKYSDTKFHNLLNDTTLGNDPGLKALQKALEYKKAALEDKKWYAQAKLAATVALAVTGVFAALAIFVAPHLMGLAGAGVAASVFAGIFIMTNEYFASEEKLYNTKVSGALRKLEVLKTLNGNTAEQLPAPPLEVEIHMPAESSRVELNRSYTPDNQFFFDSTAGKWFTADSNCYLNDSGYWFTIDNQYFLDTDNQWKINAARNASAPPAGY